MASLAQVKAMLERVRKELSPEEANDSVAVSFLSEATAARYLRGYKDETKAARNMLATFQYRRLVHADDLGTAEHTYRTVYTELGKRSMFIAATSDGADPPSPVLILRKRGDAFDKQDFEEYRRAFFFTLDCTAKLADTQLGAEDSLSQQTGQWVIVMDMQGYSSKNSPPLGVSIETLRIFQNHFPERAKRIIVLDAPLAFSVLWKVIRPMIDSVTRDKFIFISRSTGEEALRDTVGDVVWHCINMDLAEGKETSAKLMIAAGFLRAEMNELG